MSVTYDEKKTRKSFLYVTDIKRIYQGDEAAYIVIKGTYKPGNHEPLVFMCKWHDFDDKQTIDVGLIINRCCFTSDEPVVVINKESEDVVPINRIAKALGELWEEYGL